MNAVILSAIRSGSTYLARMLWDTGLFEFPKPHSDNPSLLPQQKVFEFMAPNRDVDPWMVDRKPVNKTKSWCQDYLKHKASFQGNGNQLLKILMEQYLYYELKSCVEDRLFFESLFPDSKYIWLERTDILARTVSAYLFFTTRVDHCWTKESHDEYMNRAVKIDEKGLLDVYRNHVKRCDWEDFLSGTNYVKIEYEELVENPTKTLEKCADFLGVNFDAKKIAESHPRFTTEVKESSEWKERLRTILRRGMM